MISKIFYVDVGNMSAEKAIEYLKQIKNENKGNKD